MIDIQTANNVPFDGVQHNLTNILPTASEIGYLWSSYLAETMSVCMLKYILAKSKDPDYKPIFQQALNTSSQRVKGIENIFNSVYHPIPEAFGEKDVDINARELYSESYLISYTKLTNEFILDNYCQAFNVSTRRDIKSFFSDCINTAKDIIQKSSEALLAKGLYLKPPYVAIPEKIDFVDDTDYYGSLFGGNRPPNALEINYIFTAIETKLILATLDMGLGQVAKDKKIRKHLTKGKQITQKQVQDLGSLLLRWDLPVPTTSDFEVTTSQESPFSDKLILFHNTVVTSYSILNYGRALTNTSEKSIIQTFIRLMPELLGYAKDGTDILIANNWLERPPEAADRKVLMH